MSDTPEEDDLYGSGQFLRDYQRQILSGSTYQRMQAQVQFDRIKQQLKEAGERRRKLIACDNCDAIKSGDSHICEPKYVPSNEIVGWENLGGYMGVGHR